MTLGSRYYAGYDKGTRNPMAQGGTGLTQTVYIMCRTSQNDGVANDGNPDREIAGGQGISEGEYTTTGTRKADYNGILTKLEDSVPTSSTTAATVKVVKAVMSSAIVAAPGPDTGA